MSFRRHVPNEYGHWYYHEDAGVILRNDTEYGWVSVTNVEFVERQFEELKEVVENVEKPIYSGSEAFERLIAWEEAMEAADG